MCHRSYINQSSLPPTHCTYTISDKIVEPTMAPTRTVTQTSEYVELVTPLQQEMRVSIRRQAEISQRLKGYNIDSPSTTVKRKLAQAFINIHQKKLKRLRQDVHELRGRFSR